MKHDERDPRQDGHVYRGPGEDLLKAYAVFFYPETSGKDTATERASTTASTTGGRDEP